ncbi:ZIP family metal transporter [Sedimentibacter sp. zth1]|uniref:ZIP family metal transporter n=1 Tax=Sedimentibacter sp. zth1 TaxID=2816908 RepID=UPI001A92F751|nr:ZIP family metal transporter [Sedimentibacter sp. zth1]QSX05781.1 ZIP family metal transporter [Sedimentibacter sp. zth1]
MSTLVFVIIVTAIAGVGGTGLGGIIGALFKKDSNKRVSLLLSFAAGIMLSIVCFELILGALYPENSSSQTNVFIVVGGIIFGVLLIYVLNYLIDKKSNIELAHIDKNHPKTADELDELIHSDHLQKHINNKDSKTKLFVAGIVMASAIALHNLPEGMTIGASFISDVSSGVNINTRLSSGIIMAFLIGFHNIPEGMSIAVPLISGGMSKPKAIFVTAMSGAPTVIGAILGYVIGDIGPIGLSLSLSFASGAMIYVVFGEILPQAILMYKSKLPTFFIVIGMLLGLIIIYI